MTEEPAKRTRICRGLCDDNPATLRCAGCSKQYYCSKRCQEWGWETHIFNCNTEQPIKSYHHLARAISEDLVPTDRQTLEDWGFDRAVTAKDGIYLFGLYVGLRNYLQIRAKTLDQWRRKGTLLSEIKKAYDAVPVQSRGGYYPWLLEHEYILDPSQPVPPSEEGEKLVLKMLQDGFIFAGETPLGSPEVMLEAMSVWPRQKRQCVQICGMILNQIHPTPEVDVWLDFGFGIGDQYHEICMGRLYQALISRTTFTEFHTAYENSTIVALFASKGLDKTSDYKAIPTALFEDVMGGTGIGMKKSSWHLKRMIRIHTEGGPAPSMEPSVAVDYGFMNCKGKEDFETLQEIYVTYFKSPKANPVSLHEACIKGQLYDFLNKFLKMKKGYRRLLKNPYPLPEF